jgi:hypothetical protein
MSVSRRNAISRFALVLVLSGLAAVAYAGGRNLEYYSKDMEMPALKNEMKVLKNSLGVDCSHCHQVAPKRDFATEIPMKKTARKMLFMTDKVNKDLFTKEFLGIKEGEAPKVTCYTCHKGKEKPEYKAKNAEDEKKFMAKAEDPKHKAMSDSMKKLVEKLNKDHLNWKDAPKATCWMCHRGELEFSSKAPGD